MKFSAVIALALLSTVATTLANPMKRAADAATQKANAQDAINMNNQFANLSPNTPCTDGQTACVQGSFAQCVGGKFALSQCAGGTTCCALPLVNKRGTSITCDTIADRDARIAAAQNAGGSSTPAVAPSPSPAKPTSAAPAPAAPTSSSGSGSSDISTIRMKNAAAAISQQQQFDSLTADSPCTAGQNACVQGAFAQCVGGKFASTPCAGGTKCFALPLVNKEGTSVTCDTQADRDDRIQRAQKGQA